jgi:hypothetical protein
MFKKSLLLMLLMAFMAPWAAMGQKALPYEYSFENNNLTGEGWSKAGYNNTGTGITNGTYYGSAHTGTYYFTFKYNSSNTQEQYLISPELATSSKNIVVEFYYRKYTSGTETFKVGYSTTTNNIDQFTFGDEITCSNTSYPDSPNFSQTFPAGTKYIAIYYYVYNQYYLSIDDITIEEETSCPKPTNLQASLTTGNGSIATLSWTENGTAENWVLQYGTDANFAANTYTEVSTGFVVNGSSISLPLTGLTSDQKYYARVKADCGSETGPWSGTIDFTPTDFVTIAPGTATTQSYLPIATNYKYSISQQIYTASEIGDGGTVNKISFYCASTITRSLKIYMKHTTTETYSNTTGISVAADNLVFDGSVAFTASAWTNITLDNGFDYDGENNLVLTVYDYTGEDIGYSGASFSTCRLDYVNYRSLYARNDDNAYDPTSLTSYSSRDYNRNQIRIVVTPTASCETVPTSLAVSSIDHESAILSWSGDAGTTWLVQYKENGSASWINAYEGSANTCSLTGLDELTTYNAHIKAKCNTTADYVAFDNFTTTKTPCDNPTDFTVSSITVEGATLSWTDGTAPYNVEYKTAASENWTAVEGSVNATSYELTGLVSGTEYMARVQASCQSGEADPEWVYLASNFSTLECSNPTDLSVTKVTYNSFTLSWTAGYSIAWEVQYKVKDADSWTSFGTVNTATCTLTNLQENTEYQARVKAVCNSDDWASFDNFTTTERPAIDIVLGSPYTQDYNKLNYGSSLPEGWNTSTSGAWTTNSGYMQSATSGTGYYISPVVKITGNSAKIVIKERINGTASPTCKIVVTTDGGETFDETNAITATPTTGNTATTNTYTIPEAWMGRKLQFAFKYTAASGKKWQIYSINLYIEGAVFNSDGDWNTGTWKNDLGTTVSVPTSTTDVAINAACTIPNECVAQANNITIADGKTLTLADGGQLICNNNPTVTVQKNIDAWTAGSTGGWYFIASPINVSNLNPSTVANMLPADVVSGDETTRNYDLYWLENTMWRNYRQNTFNLANGKGYLYARRENETLEFTGAIKPYTEEGNANQVPVSAGWNLIGNPYTFNAYPNTAYYTINDANNGITAETGMTTAAVAPCTGILVNVGEGGSVSFSNAAPSKSNNGNLNLVVAQAVSNRGNATAIDNAIVSFNEGSELGKFYFGEQNANLYIPQGTEEYAIVSTEAQGTMPVNFRANESGEYTLTVNPENVEMNYLHLIDNMTGADIDLLQTPSYSFNATTTDYESRFKLVFASNGTSTSSATDETFAFYSNGNWIINNAGNTTLQVVDLMGRILSSETVNGSVSKTINATPGVYMLRLINGENVKVQKIVVR